MTMDSGLRWEQDTKDDFADTSSIAWWSERWWLVDDHLSTPATMMLLPRRGKVRWRPPYVAVVVFVHSEANELGLTRGWWGGKVGFLSRGTATVGPFDTLEEAQKMTVVAYRCGVLEEPA